MDQNEQTFCYISHRYSTARRIYIHRYSTNGFSVLYHIDIVPRIGLKTNEFCFISNRYTASWLKTNVFSMYHIDIEPHELAQDGFSLIHHTDIVPRVGSRRIFCYISHRYSTARVGSRRIFCYISHRYSTAQVGSRRTYFLFYITQI